MHASTIAQLYSVRHWRGDVGRARWPSGTDLFFAVLELEAHVVAGLGLLDVLLVDRDCGNFASVLVARVRGSHSVRRVMSAGWAVRRKTRARANTAGTWLGMISSSWPILTLPASILPDTMTPMSCAGVWSAVRVGWIAGREREATRIEVERTSTAQRIRRRAN